MFWYIKHKLIHEWWWPVHYSRRVANATQRNRQRREIRWTWLSCWWEWPPLLELQSWPTWPTRAAGNRAPLPWPSWRLVFQRFIWYKRESVLCLEITSCPPRSKWVTPRSPLFCRSHQWSTHHAPRRWWTLHSTSRNRHKDTYFFRGVSQRLYV